MFMFHSLLSHWGLIYFLAQCDKVYPSFGLKGGKSIKYIIVEIQSERTEVYQWDTIDKGTSWCEKLSLVSCSFESRLNDDKLNLKGVENQKLSHSHRLSAPLKTLMTRISIKTCSMNFVAMRLFLVHLFWVRYIRYQVIKSQNKFMLNREDKNEENMKQSARNTLH